MSSTFTLVRRTQYEDASMDPPTQLKIVHVVRAPIGGIFRHIVDLADAQAAAGHEVGIICNSSTGGRFEDDIIAKAVASARARRDALSDAAQRLVLRFRDSAPRACPSRAASSERPALPWRQGRRLWAR